ncbi:hypothetical protein QQF64_015179 [Cirrhinus molitorella]|uniref:Ig-like domain-containing protein n=1 Tax=Cirrhinus molitorella TaxID=172907 RepID=A0ABR3NUG2_9TELE
MVLSILLLFWTLACVSFGNVITPVQPEVLGTEGDNITLSCNYSSAVSLQWYRQYPGSAPEFLLIILHGTGKVSQKSKIVELDPRFSGKLNEKKTHVDLEISSAKVTDSAMGGAIWRHPLLDSGVRCLTVCLLDELIYCKMVLSILLLFWTLACVSFGNVITPVQPEVLGTEGDNITLSCNYSSAVSLQWYRQYPGSAPEFLLLILHGTGKISQKSKIVELDPRFSGKLNEKKTHVDLEISSAKVTDSEMYYCALTPTVTGKQTTLYKNLSSRASEVITPKSDQEFAFEGHSVTLSCNYSGSARGVQWYRQYARSPPQFLILEDSGVKTQANPAVPGIDISHRKKESHVDLIITSAKVSDSALYYCALRPTVTGNPITLYKNSFHMLIKSRQKCVSLGNDITSVETQMSGTEGDTVSLSCSYSSARSLFWYRQYPGSAPEFLFTILHATGEVLQKSKSVDQDPRFSPKLNEKKSHVDLEISSAKVTDSALYYCALEPTVTGKQTTLYKNLTVF